MTYICIYTYMNTVHCFYRLSVGFIKSAVKANSRNTIPPIMVTINNKKDNLISFQLHYYH